MQASYVDVVVFPDQRCGSEQVDTSRMESLIWKARADGLILLPISK